MRHFLGIDAGATRTRCILASETDVLARAKGGCIKITRVGESVAQHNLDEILEEVVRQSGVALRSVARTCVGLSGVSIASVSEWTRRALEAQVGGELSIFGDEEIALDAAFQGGRGVLAIAGTGSNVLARTADGQLAHAGGWGPVLSDQGAGSRIGLLAARAIFLSIDGSRQTSLLPALHAAWNTRTLEELIDLGNRSPGPDFSLLAPMVARCAREGDTVAQEVLRHSGEELAELVVLAIDKASSLERSAGITSGPWTIAYTGSVVENISLLRESMVAAVRRTHPTVQLHPEATDPVLGALWRARNP
jgi:N-acetylglucosamine kinase-like BadF-type ATPase